MEYSNEVKIYRRRKPRETSLWKLLDHHFLEFEERYDDLFQQQYGFYRPVVSHVVRQYLECGNLRENFARIKCPDCHHEYIWHSVAGAYAPPCTGIGCIGVGCTGVKGKSTGFSNANFGGSEHLGQSA